MLGKLAILISCYTLVVSLGIDASSIGYYWEEYKEELPHDAFMGAPNLYIAQVVYGNGITPGTFYPDTKEVVTEANTERFNQSYDFKILCSPNQNNFEWENINIDRVRRDKLGKLVIGGYGLESTLYIGKVFHDRQWKIGKVYPPTSEYKGLRIWDEDNKLVALQNFEILKYNNGGLITPVTPVVANNNTNKLS